MADDSSFKMNDDTEESNNGLLQGTENFVSDIKGGT
jgi:hypothetical protein